MRILIAHSYKGGNGKTLFSSNISSILTELGQRVLLIESDFNMPSFTEIFSEFTPDIFLNDYLKQEENSLTRYIYPDTKAQFGIIYANKQFTSSDKVHSSNLSWFNEQRMRMQKDLKLLDYDFIIFDTAPGMHFFTINTLSIATDICLLIRPDIHSLIGTQHMLDRIYRRALRMKNVQFTLIFNQIPRFEKMNRVIEEWKIRYKGRYDFITDIHEINYEPETAYNTAVNQLILPEIDPTRKVLEEIARKLLDK